MLAPDITPNHVSIYRQLAEAAQTSVKEPMLLLCNMVEEFRKTPESTLKGKPVKFLTPSVNKMGVATPLEPAEIHRMDAHVPYPDELEVYGNRFETLPNGDLRNAAFHLLWFANELVRDREPITREKVFSAEELAAIDAEQIKRIGKNTITIVK